MLDSSPFAYYNVAVGVVTGCGVLYFLFFKPTVVDYDRFLLITVFGLLLFLVGGPILDLFFPILVHWVHGLAAFLVILGLYDPLENDLRRDAWANILLQNPQQVRHQENWMLPIDDRILELFHSNELVLTPAIIAYNIEYSREEVNRRLSKLSSRGLVNKVDHGKYQITALGRQYIEGSVSSSPATRLLASWREGRDL